jgi:8-oxo-dGTP pyrophosphatase MutT (NUDIX family)
MHVARGMSIPLGDVQLLRSIVRGVQREKLRFYKPYTNRAASAIILRFNGEDGVKVARCFSTADKGIKPEEAIDRLEFHSDANATSSLSMLFLRKKLVEESRWAGVVAFPGGKRDKHDDKDDFACVKRWCDYQLGMPIHTSDFILLGRLPDYYMHSRAMHRGLMTARFVFLHVGELTPSVRLAHFDIKALTWAPITALQPKNVIRSKEVHNLFAYFVKEEWREFVGGHLPGAKLHFPSIAMPENFGQLWGFTLSSTSTLLSLHGQQRLDWPLFHSNSLVAQILFVDPLHGYLELTKNEVVAETRVQHQLSLALIAFAALTVVLMILSYLALIVQATVVSLSPQEMLKRKKEKIDAYFDQDITVYKSLAADVDGTERQRKEMSRTAASNRWNAYVKKNQPPEQKRLLSFSAPIDEPASTDAPQTT